VNTRHESRLWAVQLLFQREFNHGDLAEALKDFWDGHKASAKLRAFTEEMVRGVELNRPSIDEKLQRYAENWDLKRMGAVDRNVMRLALYEMHFCPDIPPVVSINEAVDLAKELSSDESGRFVNGILDRALRDVDRPARTAGKARE
jgi:N utilization substance protein B